MNPRKTIIAILATLSASIALADDFKTASGKEYKDATVSRVEPDGIIVKTKSGISKIYFVELPKEVQARFGHDPDKIAAEKAAARAAEEKRIEQEKETERAEREKERETERAEREKEKETERARWEKEKERNAAVAAQAHVDLNAPATKQVTVATEIARGATALNGIESQGRPLNLFYAAQAVFEKNKQANTDTDGFKLGATLSLWFDWLLYAWHEPNVILSRQDIDYAKSEATAAFKDWRERAAKLGLDDRKLIETAGLNVDYVLPKIRQFEKGEVGSLDR
jgi:sRNA-binding protein